MGRETEITKIIIAPERSSNTMRKVAIRLLFAGDIGLVADTSYEVGPHAAVIGRLAEDNGILLTDPAVSRRHATILSPAHANGIFLDDTSTNGSSVNAKKVTSAFMNDGDILRVGNSFFVVRCYRQEPQNAAISELVGISVEMGRLRAAISMVAPTEATALIIGESGTGKELVARAIHRLSGRKGAYVPVNCAAIPSTLAESQLFGHIAGAFTGAKGNHDGFFRQANGGTLFLDEVGELPLDIQPKLLRVLEDRAVTPVGDVKTIPLDIRIVAATNRNLEEAIGEQRFRGDLFARIAELTLNTPPLRDRREDILPLFQLGFGKNMPELSPELVESLLVYGWPFNVRELFKVARECRIQSKGDCRLELRHVEHRLRPPTYNTHVSTETYPGATDTGVTSASPLQTYPGSASSGGGTSSPSPLFTKKGRSDAPSREEVESGLQTSRGNISHLSRILGRSRRQVYRYLEMYNINLMVYR